MKDDDADDRNRLEAFLRKSAKLGYRSVRQLSSVSMTMPIVNC